MHWIHDAPRWLAALAVIGTFTGLALAGLVATRGFIRSRGLHAIIDNGVVGWMFSAILAMYAITIGLTAVASWTNAGDAAEDASSEASEIAAFYRDAAGYPEPVRTELTGRVRTYLHAIIETDWPIQRRGQIPRRGTPILDQIQATLYAFEPASQGQAVIHGEAMSSFNRLVETRRKRLAGVRSSVPGTLWCVVLVGAIVAIGASYVFTLDSIGVHAVMTVLLSSMIGLLVFFIAVTDMPYRGASGIEPGPYELALHDLTGGKDAASGRGGAP
jgi:hypothetical protein